MTSKSFSVNGVKQECVLSYMSYTIFMVYQFINMLKTKCNKMSGKRSGEKACRMLMIIA